MALGDKPNDTQGHLVFLGHQASIVACNFQLSHNIIYNNRLMTTYVQLSCQKVKLHDVVPCWIKLNPCGIDSSDALLVSYSQTHGQTITGWQVVYLNILHFRSLFSLYRMKQLMPASWYLARRGAAWRGVVLIYESEKQVHSCPISLYAHKKLTKFWVLYNEFKIPRTLVV